MTSRFVLPLADVGNGISPSDGAKLTFFITGTSTLKDTFSDEAGTIPNTNPVVADGDGLFPEIWITGTYKVTLTDKNNKPKWEEDPVSEVITTSSTITADSEQVTYTAPFTGSVASNVEAKLSESLGVKDFGAIGDGSDETTEILAALTAATPTSSTVFSSVGGNNVHFAAGVYGFTGEIVIPEWVNIIGEGKGLTEFKALDAAATIRFGTKSGAFGPSERGGESGGFVINGNNLSNLGLHIGFVVEREFHDINVYDCKGVANGDGILIEAAQNCNFSGVSSQHNGGLLGVGSNIVLDYGAGNNRFWGPEVNRPGEYNIKFIQSGSSPTGAFTVPTGNRFYGGMIERWEDQDGGGTVTSLGTIYHGAGRENYFDNPDFSLTGLPTPLPVIKVRKDGSGASTLLTLNNPKFHGTAGQAVAVDIDDATNLHITGVGFFENFATVFKIGDSAAVHIIGEVEDSSGGDLFANNGGGVKTQDQLLFRRMLDITTRNQRSGAGDTAVSIGVTGESFERWVLRPNGIAAGTGAGAPDVVLSRDSAAGVASWKMDTAILELGAAGIIIVTGVPTIAVPDGFFAFRTDGGSGTSIYQRTGSAWVARA